MTANAASGGTARSARRPLSQINVGIVGVAGRGGRLRHAIEQLPWARLHSICDTDAAGLERAAAGLAAGGGDRAAAPETYREYDAMLEDSTLDAVLIGTPMPLHVPQAIAALERGRHVLSEVPAGVEVDECRRLVAAATTGGARYMMAENIIYRRNNQIVEEIARQGLFGTPYYAEGEYLHELKQLNEVTRWRRRWQTGVNGITYGTHSLGPVLRWMPGDRVARVCCAGTGHHYRDPRGDRYQNEDTCVMLCQMQSGGLAKIRVDMLSDRPHGMNNFQLQGTDGCYESARAAGEPDRIWLRSRSPDSERWQPLEALAEEFLPERWRRYGTAAERAGHGGGDLFVVREFLEAVHSDREPEIGIHQAMDMTLPGLISQQSIAQGGAWLEVPDSRRWAG